MEASQAFLKVAMEAQVAFTVISALAMAAGIASAGRTLKITRKAYIVRLCLACLLILPSFFLLKPLIFPELDFSDPNPGDAALVQAARLMGFAFIPTALLMGRYTAYRNRDIGNTDRIAYLAAIPVFGSIWILRLLFKPSETPAR
jgi:hypothetical protein